MFRVWVKRISSVGALGLTGGAATWLWYDHKTEAGFGQILMQTAKNAAPDINVRPQIPLPTRNEMLDLTKTVEYDVLVIGGGATGAGVVLDSQSRGLSSALVELDDFSSGTSSRSTKLIHGGVRYLQSAILRFDFEQYRMVKEALFERGNLLEIGPHLSHPLPIMLPIYKWWQVPYFWAGIKAYDLVSGKRLLKSSYYVSKKKALELFPMLKKDALVGALIYYDGAHNDARMNLAIILTAIRKGAQCVNHTSVTKILKDENGKACGAKVKDMITGNEWDIKAKCVINATGPFTDSIRQMDNPNVAKICVPSSGVHIVLPGYYSPSNTGLLDPSTSDGRVIFFLPWEKFTIAGTTDSPCDVTHNPAPANSDVDFILKEVRNYLSNDISVRRGDVMSAWAGLRPLVKDPSKKDTASLARNHIIEVSDSNMITIAGGKWTTYRHMAEETIDRAVKECGLQQKNGCVTAGLLLEGSHDWNELMYIRLVQDYGLEPDVAEHLSRTYGDRAYSVAKLSRLTGKRWPIIGVRLNEEFPYLEAEVVYACKEYAVTAVDMISRRLRLAFLNTYAAEQALPRIVEIMAGEMGWSRQEQQKQLAEATEFIRVEMGKLARHKSLEETPMNLTGAELKIAKEKFEMLDTNKKGKVTINDLRRYFKERGEKIDERSLHELLDEVDLNKNGEVDMTEFMLLYSGLKGGQVAGSRLFSMLEDKEKTEGRVNKISTLRSGGGV